MTDVGAYEYYEGPDTSAPATPVLLAAKNVGPSGFTLTWSASTDNVHVYGYDVYLDGELDTSVNSTTVIFTNLADSTSYTLTVIAKDASDNLSAESNPLQVTTLSLSTGVTGDRSNEGSVLVYPNPVNDGEFTIRLDKWENHLLTVEVVDETGKIILSQPVQANNSNLTISRRFRRGLYIIRIIDGQKSVSQKLIVE
jgi:hypothetical protein